MFPPAHSTEIDEFPSDGRQPGNIGEIDERPVRMPVLYRQQERAVPVGECAMGRAENARALAYRLYTVSERKGWTGEALACNILVASWPQIRARAAELAAGGPAQAEMGV